MEKIIRNFIHQHEDNNIIITSEDNGNLTYGEFKKFNEKLSRELSAQKFKNEDRVAIVLPNGPYMATAFLGMSSYMSAAPLNPTYTQEEFEFYLNDLKPKFVIVELNSSNEVIKAAKNLKIPICELKVTKNNPLGTFQLFENEEDYINPSSETEALVLHTSGTTSRPKIVPLTNKNIFSSAYNIARSLNLNSSDHCLNIMPLFHIHGLIAVLAASVKVGASICTSNGFNALKFLELAKSQKITWYSGVPTMHQAILLRAEKNKILAKNLKFKIY